jgi:hypothetical protein
VASWRSVNLAGVFFSLHLENGDFSILMKDILWNCGRNLGCVLVYDCLAKNFEQIIIICLICNSHQELIKSLVCNGS